MLSRLVHIFTSFRGLIYDPYIRLSVKYHRAGLSHLVSRASMSMARALSKTTAAIHSSFGFKAYNSIANLQRGRPVVTMMTVRPRFRMRPSISRSVLGSRADVHSSSRSTGDWSRPHAQRQGVAPGLRTSCRWCRPRLGPSGTICRRSLRRSKCGRCR